MFTSEPSLTQRIERLIRDQVIVDPHTHIRCDRPSAPDLASLMSYHWVQTELIAVGMPREDLDATLPSDERVRRAIPYLRRMRNTAVAWCLYRILRDLYDFRDPHLTEQNYRDVLDRVEATGRDPEWARHVLRDWCKVETFVTSLGNRGPDPVRPPADVRFMLDAHYLVCPGVATDLLPFFPNRTSKLEYYDALVAILGDRVSTPEVLSRKLLDWLDATVCGDVRFTNVFLPIEARFVAPDDSATARVLTRAAQGGDLDSEDVDALVRAVTWTLLEWHHERRKAFQIAVGAEYFICDGKSIPRFQETWTSEMARAFHRFGNCRFDLLMASDVLAHEAAVLARQFPNVYVSGYWWHNFQPPTIEKNVAMRLMVAPMTKFGGFLCDAYYAEWTYGKRQVVGKAMASAFAHLVETGYYEEEDVPTILDQILYQTPRDLYDLA
jgi:glucuronate isomerase